ncbi:MAG: SCP2 sterol-binding domain-containing protein [Proteobacteria bacterium]|nr:SCP2 sterol-binding domain-containing protein [Pseudomonadota bacterium]
MARFTNAEQIRESIRDKSDAEIVSALQDRGIDSVLDQVFEGMQEAFNADKASGQSAVIQFDVECPDQVRSYQLHVADGQCSLNKGVEASARVTLSLNLPCFMRFVTGHLDGMQAFMAGQLRITGDVIFAQNIQSWFDQPS